MSNIISISGEEIPAGEFYGFNTIVASSRQECIELLTNRAPFADDIGASERVDTWVDDEGIEYSRTIELYTMIGGVING